MKSLNCYRCSSSSSTRTSFDPQHLTKTLSSVCLDCLESFLVQQTQSLSLEEGLLSDDETYFSGESPQDVNCLKSLCDFYDKEKPASKLRGKIFKYPIKPTRSIHYNRIKNKNHSSSHVENQIKGVLFGIHERFRDLRKEIDLQEEKIYLQLSSSLKDKHKVQVNQIWTENLSEALDNLTTSALPLFENFKMTLENDVLPLMTEAKQSLIRSLFIEVQEDLLVLSQNNFNQSSLLILENAVENWEKQTRKKAFLDFSNKGLNSDSINEINQIFDQFQDIYEFRINFSRGTFTDKQVLAICWDKINTMKKLQVLEINLDQCYSLTDEGIAYIFQTIFPNVKRLQSLEIRLSETNITDSSLRSLNTCLPQLWGGLINFNLDLYGTKITDLAVQEFCSTMKKVALNLRKFAFSLSQTKVTDSSMTVFSSEVVSSMPLLQEFELYLSSTRISDSGIEQLCAALTKFLPSIQAFTLNLGNLNLTEKTFQLLSQNLFTEMKALQKLELFCYNTNLQDRNFKSLLKSVNESMKDLEILELNLDFTSVSDAGVEFFVRSFNKLKSCNLSINCTQVTQKMKNSLENYF